MGDNPKSNQQEPIIPESETTSNEMLQKALAELRKPENRENNQAFAVAFYEAFKSLAGHWTEECREIYCEIARYNLEASNLDLKIKYYLEKYLQMKLEYYVDLARIGEEASKEEQRKKRDKKFKDDLAVEYFNYLIGLPQIKEKFLQSAKEFLNLEQDEQNSENIWIFASMAFDNIREDDNVLNPHPNLKAQTEIIDRIIKIGKEKDGVSLSHSVKNGMLIFSNYINPQLTNPDIVKKEIINYFNSVVEQEKEK